MAKMKYEKPELVDLNERNVVQGICNSGSVNTVNKCDTGGSAPSGNCLSGTSASVGGRCVAGGNN